MFQMATTNAHSNFSRCSLLEKISALSLPFPRFYRFKRFLLLRSKFIQKLCTIHQLQIVTVYSEWRFATLDGGEGRETNKRSPRFSSQPFQSHHATRIHPSLLSSSFRLTCSWHNVYFVYFFSPPLTHILFFILHLLFAIFVK